MLDDAQAGKFFSTVGEELLEVSRGEESITLIAKSGVQVSLPVVLESGISRRGSDFYFMPKILRKVRPKLWRILSPQAQLLEDIAIHRNRLLSIKRAQGMEPFRLALDNVVGRFVRNISWIDLDEDVTHPGKTQMAQRVKVELPPITPKRGVPMAERTITVVQEIASSLVNYFDIVTTDTSRPGEVVEKKGPLGKFSDTIERFVPFSPHLHPKRHSISAAGARNCQLPLNNSTPIVGIENQPDLPGVNALVALACDPLGRTTSDMIMVRKGFLPSLDTMWVVRTRVTEPSWVAPEGTCFSAEDYSPVAIDSFGNKVFPKIPYPDGKVWFVTGHHHHGNITTIITTTKIKAADGTKITTRHSSKGTICTAADKDMPIVDICGEAVPVDMVINPESLERRGTFSLILEMLASRIAMEKRIFPPRIDVPINAKSDWILKQIEQEDIMPKKPMAQKVIIGGSTTYQPIGEFFVGWVQILLQPQHPDVVGKIRKDNIHCPDCNRAVDNPSNICTHCFQAGISTIPSLPSGQVPNKGAFGVKVIRPYWALLKGLKGMDATVKELANQRNPAIREFLQEMLEMIWN